MELILQKQPTKVTCVQTCLAMAMGVPVGDVVSTFGDSPQSHDELIAALRACRILHVPLAFPSLVIHGWHFAVVPSLNVRGGHHQVLVYNDMENYVCKVLDPSARETYKEDGSDLISWADLIYFHPGGKLPLRRVDVSTPTPS